MARPIAGDRTRVELRCGAVREMTHWYTCPATGCPVLVCVTEVPVYADPMREGAD